MLSTDFKYNSSATNNVAVDTDSINLPNNQTTSNLSSVTEVTGAMNHTIEEPSDIKKYADDDVIETSDIPGKMSGVVYGILLSVFVGFCSSAALLFMSETDLKNKQGALIPLLWQYSAGGLIVCGLMLIQYLANLTEPLTLGMSLTDAILVTVHVTSLVSGNWLVITALYYCDAFLSGLCRNTDLVFMAVSSWTILWGLVPAHGNALEVLGMVLILVASAIAVVSKYLKEQKILNRTHDEGET